ncbi:hypothetical protein AWZ03_014772 [Drosophila navojoa]|uniref:Reverse transcriptase domain-containing protein n=1 Tax=Drosophila navojoa TaxID=7232 RepID=A0A484APS6_DRONA|nr:hypothetical protein AWZ03_014772 [Drosophila navojoa]
MGRVSAGVPQGSVLGPILYTIFSSDMPLPSQEHTNRIGLPQEEMLLSTFADDTVIISTAELPDMAVRANERDGRITRAAAVARVQRHPLAIKKIIVPDYDEDQDDVPQAAATVVPTSAPAPVPIVIATATPAPTLTTTEVFQTAATPTTAVAAAPVTSAVLETAMLCQTTASTTPATMDALAAPTSSQTAMKAPQATVATTTMVATILRAIDAVSTTVLPLLTAYPLTTDPSIDTADQEALLDEGLEGIRTRLEHILDADEKRMEQHLREAHPPY